MTDKLAKRLQLSSQYKEALSVSTFAAQDVDTYVVQFNLITKNGTSFNYHFRLMLSIKLQVQSIRDHYSHLI